MEYQRFVPEGWKENEVPISKNYLEEVMQTGTIMQGIVKECDANYNLHIDFGNHMQGIIPREEIEAVNVDENGFPKPSICMSKVNQYVQFKIKDIDEKNQYILSRKEVGKEALNWVKEELKEGEIINRNCEKYSTLWCICRNWRRRSRPSSY